jgi:hypothetical protein
VRASEDLVADIHRLQKSRPRGWLAKEAALELELNDRFWEANRPTSHDDDPAPAPTVAEGDSPSA